MLRSAASPESAGFGRPGTMGVASSTHRARPATLLLWPQPSHRATKRAPEGALAVAMALRSRLLDLGFYKFDVLLGDRIVFLHFQLLGHRARVLARDVIEPGVGTREQLDLGGDGFGHGK